MAKRKFSFVDPRTGRVIRRSTMSDLRRIASKIQKETGSSQAKQIKQQIKAQSFEGKRRAGLKLQAGIRRATDPVRIAIATAIAKTPGAIKDKGLRKAIERGIRQAAAKKLKADIKKARTIKLGKSQKELESQIKTMFARQRLKAPSTKTTSKAIVKPREIKGKELEALLRKANQKKIADYIKAKYNALPLKIRQAAKGSKEFIQGIQSKIVKALEKDIVSLTAKEKTLLKGKPKVSTVGKKPGIIKKAISKIPLPSPRDAALAIIGLRKGLAQAGTVVTQPLKTAKAINVAFEDPFLPSTLIRNAQSSLKRNPIGTLAEYAGSAIFLKVGRNLLKNAVTAAKTKRFSLGKLNPLGGYSVKRKGSFQYIKTKGGKPKKVFFTKEIKVNFAGDGYIKIKFLQNGKVIKQANKKLSLKKELGLKKVNAKEILQALKVSPKKIKLSLKKAKLKTKLKVTAKKIKAKAKLKSKRIKAKGKAKLKPQVKPLPKVKVKLKGKLTLKNKLKIKAKLKFKIRAKLNLKKRSSDKEKKKLEIKLKKELQLKKKLDKEDKKRKDIEERLRKELRRKKTKDLKRKLDNARKKRDDIKKKKRQKNRDIKKLKQELKKLVNQINLIKRYLDKFNSNKKFAFTPDLYSSLVGAKATAAERKELLRVGKVFTGLEQRKIV